MTVACLWLVACGNPDVRAAQEAGSTPPPKVTPATAYARALQGDMILPDDGPGSEARDRLRKAVFETAIASRAAPCDGRAAARFVVAFHDYAAARAAMLRENPDNRAYWMTRDDYHAHQLLELQYMHGYIDHQAQRRAVSGPGRKLVTPEEGGGGWAAPRRPTIEPACARATRGEPLAALTFWPLRPPLSQHEVAEHERRGRDQRREAERVMLKALEPPDAVLCGAGREDFLSTADYYYQQRLANTQGDGRRKGEAARMASELAWASGAGSRIDVRLKQLVAKGCLARENLPYRIARPLFDGA